MKEPLDVPADIAHLIEKRDKEDRRAPAPPEGKAPEKPSSRPAAERRRRTRRKS
jgi:hypothetical protein